MKIVSTSIYPLNIPFVESFSHNLSKRNHSDSIVVKVTTESGVSGFGEGVPRPYVTGETRDASIAYIRDSLLPQIIGVDLNDLSAENALADIANLLSTKPSSTEVIWNASLSAVELALTDCFFREKRLSIAEILPPVIQQVSYSGIISSGSEDKVKKIAQRCKDTGFKHIKMKVTGINDANMVGTVRNILGADVSLRLDANAAFNCETALEFIKSVEKYNIASIEQPIPRGDPAKLAALRSSSPIPLMADESIVTLQDARDLKDAVDYFNLRLSKCGGFFNTLAIYKYAVSAGIGVQLGCQVGETAILSAAGRHLAAHLRELQFTEGSYSTLLLKEDISKERIIIGTNGNSDPLTGNGLGITVQEELLDKYAENKILVH